MLKKIIIAAVLLVLAYLFYDLYAVYVLKGELTGIAHHFASKGAEEVGAANLVTAVVVTYRGFDTLGEVTILFLTASIISFFLKLNDEDSESSIVHRDTSELLQTASQLLVPIIFLFGIYVFINGHITPGGGFQGGAIIATGVALMILSNPNIKINYTVIHWVESISGVAFVMIGLLGLILAGGFLDNSILGLGQLGELFSAGAIPIIYSFVGLKVGAEISNILDKYQKSQKETK
jgi:multicomponent Na+:H+ antiporter subunit B